MADKYGSYAAETLGGSHDKPKKEIKEIHTSKTKNGDHVHVHHFTHPEHHASETHTTRGDDELAAHMMAHMGTPNEGESGASDPTSLSAMAQGNTSPSAPAAGGAAPVQDAQVASL